MNLQSDTPEYIEAFTRTLMDHGVPEETAGSLYHQARVGEALDDPWFREGFQDILGEKRAGMEKQAVGKLAPIAYRVAGQSAKKGIPRALKWGAGILGLGGAGVGGSYAAARGSTGASPWSAVNSPLSRPKLRTPGIPDWALKSTPTPSTPGRSGNPFGYIDGFSVKPGDSEETGTGPLAASRAAAEHLKALQKRHTDLTSRTPGEGLAGAMELRRNSAEARRLARDIQGAERTLTREYFTNYQAPARRGLRSIGKVREDLQGQLSDYTGKSNELSEYLRASEGNPWTAPWNLITRPERRAEKLLGRTATLQERLKQLDDWEGNLRRGGSL